MLDDLTLERALTRAYEDVSATIPFGRSLWDQSQGLWPRMHQIIRMHEVMGNKTKRLVLEDTTSSGKTLNAIGIKGLLDQQNPENRALLVAPNQAIASAWNEDEINYYTQGLGLPNQRVLRLEDARIPELLQADIIQVNYDKLSRLDTDAYTNQHLEKLRTILPHIDLVISDEGHNLKNIDANRTRTFIDIVEQTKDKNFLMLSASAIPNRIKDIGFLLYMFDPEKYAHYSANPFDYSQDRFSIRNARNSPGWFTFSRGDLGHLIDMPEFTLGNPLIGLDPQHRFQMSEKFADQYFEEWSRDSDGLGKIGKLSKILLQSEVDEIVSLCETVKKSDPDAQVSVFSFYTNGFSRQLCQQLSTRLGGVAEYINGDYPSAQSTTEKVEKRMEIINAFNRGDIEYLVNTTSTAGESISLVTGERPVYVFFAEPPTTPATYDQAIGRFLRLGQEGPVYVTEIMPTSDSMNERMIEEKKRRKEEGIRYRASWTPGTIFEDGPKIRDEKESKKDAVLAADVIDDLSEFCLIEEDESQGYTTIPKKEDDQPLNPNKSLNEKLKPVRRYIGHPLEKLLESKEKELLIRGYSSDDWELTSSAETNRVIKEVISTIEGQEGALENILDWGCGSACLARILRRPITNLDALPQMLKKGKEKCKEEGIYNGQEFVEGNARNMPFDDGSFDLVSSAYALQYNAQGYQHRRDIEEILLETNRILRPEGFGILALPNQAIGTSTDICKPTEQLDALIERYGFKVRYSDFISGYTEDQSENKKVKVFNGFQLTLFQKEEGASELNADYQDDVFIFSPYKLLGVGGRKRESQKGTDNGRGRETQLSSYFEGRDGNGIAGSINGAIRK
tara:strand:- start:967 stop:3510 length:2544 start_codon:yes stop_codon:yes gene_type:complete